MQNREWRIQREDNNDDVVKIMTQLERREYCGSNKHYGLSVFDEKSQTQIELFLDNYNKVTSVRWTPNYMKVLIELMSALAPEQPAKSNQLALAPEQPTKCRSLGRAPKQSPTIRRSFRAATGGRHRPQTLSRTGRPAATCLRIVIAADAVRATADHDAVRAERSGRQGPHGARRTRRRRQHRRPFLFRSLEILPPGRARVRR